MNSIQVTKYLESKYPKTLAYDWDNPGLQVGSLNKKCLKVMVTLDVTKEVVKEAINLDVDLIISHHPLIFKPISNIITESPRGKILSDLIKNNIAVYSMHTNYDLSVGGMNDELANVLEMENPVVLDDVEGIGRVGTVKERPMAEMIDFIKEKLEIDHCRFIGKLDSSVKILGVSGGSGSNHVGAAMKKQCDLYITGDVTYHTALDCIQMGQNVLDVGHYAEKIFKKAVQKDLQNTFPEIQIIISQIDTDPYINR